MTIDDKAKAAPARDQEKWAPIFRPIARQIKIWSKSLLPKSATLAGFALGTASQT
jgi:hypothetical protein